MKLPTDTDRKTRQTLAACSRQSLHGGDNTTKVNKQHSCICNTISRMYTVFH